MLESMTGGKSCDFASMLLLLFTPLLTLGGVKEESCATRVSNRRGSQFGPQRPNHSGGAALHSYMLRCRQIKTIMVTSNMLR